MLRGINTTRNICSQQIFTVLQRRPKGTSSRNMVWKLCRGAAHRLCLKLWDQNSDLDVQRCWRSNTKPSNLSMHQTTPRRLRPQDGGTEAWFIELFLKADHGTLETITSVEYKLKVAYLVKSVFKAPVPAYCLAQALALSAQALGKIKQLKVIKVPTKILIQNINFKIWTTLLLLRNYLPFL